MNYFTAFEMRETDITINGDTQFMLTIGSRKCFNVTIIDDDEPEETEYFHLRARAPNNGTRVVECNLYYKPHKCRIVCVNELLCATIALNTSLNSLTIALNTSLNSL